MTISESVTPVCPHVGLPPTLNTNAKANTTQMVKEIAFSILCCDFRYVRSIFHPSPCMNI